MTSVPTPADAQQDLGALLEQLRALAATDPQAAADLADIEAEVSRAMAAVMARRASDEVGPQDEGL